MNNALDALAMMLILLVSVWVIGFGAIGATLARRAGKHPLSGFTIGALLGPFGIGLLWWRGRATGGTSEAGRPGSGGEADAVISL